MTEYENPQAYWEKRLANHFDLEGAGFGSLGPNYNAIMYEARRRTLLQTIRVCGTQLKGQHVLEVGCGSGFYTELCQHEGVASYTGIDITEISVQNLSSSYPEFHFVRADISDDAVPINDQFDIVLVADVLFHIVDANRFRNAIEHISHLIKPKGYLILSDLLTIATVQTASHVRFRSLEEYKSILADNDITLKHVEPIFAVLQPPIRVHGTSLLWNLYALIWLYGGMRMAHWRWFDRLIPRILNKLDQSFFLPRANVRTPNNKWLVGVKDK